MGITRIGRVILPVSDQDKALEFYTGTLGFEVVADMPFGDGNRWLEVAPPGAEARIALQPPGTTCPRMTMADTPPNK